MLNNCISSPIPGRENGVVTNVALPGGKRIIVATDRVDYPGRDRVFPVFSDENGLLLHVIGVQKWDRVLDLGTGSGILALAAAKAGALALGVDISARAIEFAMENVVRNRLQDRVTIMRADISDVWRNDGWNLVVANPPFVPVPPENEFHIAGDGGVKGDDVIRKVLSVWERVLPNGATCVLLAMTLRDSQGVRLVDRLVSSVTENRTPRRTVAIYDRPLPLEYLWACFRVWDPKKEWLEWLYSEGYTDIEYVCVAAGPMSSAIARKVAITKQCEETFSGSWSARLQRWSLWSNTHGARVVEV
jgi:methylase of polypeptide subunit release factors